jgi:hypothetical protein
MRMKKKDTKRDEGKNEEEGGWVGKGREKRGEGKNENETITHRTVHIKSMLAHQSCK